jgi:hypothetical protein
MNAKSIKSRLVGAVVLFVGLLIAPLAWSDTLETVEHRITSSLNHETTPTVANDGETDLVVYTVREALSSGNIGSGDIYYQRLVDGAPSGAPVQVTSGSPDFQLNDVSGDYIVFTVFNSVTSNSGSILIYQISTGIIRTLGTATIIQEPRIHGNRVVWREGGAFAAMVMYMELQWVPINRVAEIIAGPIPPTFDVQIGSDYAVWAELDGGTYDVYAYDLSTLQEIRVTNTPGINERQPATSGDWIAWQQQDGTAMTIEAKNMLSMERVIIDNGAGNYNPSIDGDLISWTTDVAGNLDIWVHRLSVGESYAVTTDPDDQYLSEVFGDIVAYVKASDVGNLNLDRDVYVSTLEFIPDQPVALAGPDQSVHIGSVVTLDGTGSYDPDGDYPLVYEWQLYNFGLTATPNITDQLSPSASDPSPSFDANLATDYIAYLGVIDNEGNHSEVDTVTISTTNTRPLADAGADQAVDLVGSIVTLDGFHSYDDDDDPLNYVWSLTTRPLASTAQLDNPFVDNPSFVADVNGEYRASLVVNDGWADSDPDEVIVSFDNVVPVADAGGNQAVTVGDTVTLVGSGTDANGDPLTYEWRFVSVPAGSAALLEGVNQPTASFVADADGTYLVSLVVNDGIEDSLPSNVSILATLSQDQVIDRLEIAIDVINDLPADVFKNKNRAGALTNKLLAVIKQVERGDYVQARNKLVNDVMAKTSGCAASGAPDNNDWIETCGAQGQIYPLFVEILTILNELIGP